MPILYCHHESGHSYKVALALSLIGVAFEQRPVDLNLPRAQRDADFVAASLFGEVPVLVFDDGLAVSQSNAILDTIARRYGRLDGRDEREQVRVREWLSWEANRLASEPAAPAFFQALHAGRRGARCLVRRAHACRSCAP